MITYLPKQKLFHLTNKSISYYIYLNEEGYLETIYFGKYLPSIENVDWIRKPTVIIMQLNIFLLKIKKNILLKIILDQIEQDLKFLHMEKMIKEARQLLLEKKMALI